jgi:hypothetical protein
LKAASGFGTPEPPLLTITPCPSFVKEKDQGDGTYFSIVKISLNSQKFSRKTNHNEPSVCGAQRRHEAPRYSFLLPLCVLEPKVRCGSKFFNVLINFSLWKVSAVALEKYQGIPLRKR